MIFELIATIVAGVAAGLLVWAVNRTLKGRLPGWLVPVAAGAAMLAATISSEYSWYARTAGTMPQSLIVAQTAEEVNFYRPWTFAKPFVSRYVAVDAASLRTNPDQPGQRIVDLVFFGRWARTSKVPMLFDCANSKQADILDGIEFGADGEVLNVTWRDVAPDDPLQKTACTEV